MEKYRDEQILDNECNLDQGRSLKRILLLNHQGLYYLNKLTINCEGYLLLHIKLPKSSDHPAQMHHKA
jgi:hypothetical protein